MALSVLAANDYISLYCVDVENWLDSEDEAQKTRYINVAERTLKRVYKDLMIPDEAVYEFANVLSINFSDTNKPQMQGVNNFTINGLGQWDFRGNGVRLASDVDFADFIPKASKELIAEANGDVKITSKVKWTGV